MTTDEASAPRSPREELSRAKTVVVKVGSRTLSTRPQLPDELAAQFARLRERGVRIVLVSSGAVALGMKRLGLRERPTELPLLQAAASLGQSHLIRRYEEALAPHSLDAAQVLLTHGDLSNRKRLNNARSALGALLDAGAIPIINENDAVSVEDLRFSDNDQLAALVAPLVSADALILLTDVAGVLDAGGARISVMMDDAAFIDQGKKDEVGRGGMAGKISAAVQARRAGASVVIASALEEGVLLHVLSGEDVGTYFPPLVDTFRARQHWIAYTLRSRGTILVDDGARTALLEQNRSLLPVGVVGLRGAFRKGDAVRIVSLSGEELGRGLSRLDALEVARAAGKKGQELSLVLGGDADGVVIHRDDLVVWPRSSDARLR